MNDKEIMIELNRCMTAIMPASPNYRYYGSPGSKDQYFYTTDKVLHKDRQRYLSGIYRFVKSKQGWKLVKSSVVGHAKKKDATAKALRMAKEER